MGGGVGIGLTNTSGLMARAKTEDITTAGAQELET